MLRKNRLKKLPIMLELKQFLQLGWPILLAELLQMSMGFVDTVMAGQYGATDLAAVALGTSILFPVIIFLVGILLAVIPTVSQYFGARQYDLIGPYVQQSIWLGLILGLLAMALIGIAEPLFVLLNINGVLRSIALNYLHAAAFALPAIAILQSLRCFSEGLGITKPIMVISLISLLLNIPANYLLIYGKLGLPEMGGAGCGWASAMSFWISLLIMLGYVSWRQDYRLFAILSHFPRPEPSTLLAILKLGLPIGLAIFMETTAFSVVALFLAPMGATVVAGHQLVLNFSSMVFMVPLSIGMVLTIRVGQSVGAGRPDLIARTIKVGFSLALMLALVSCSLMLLWPKTLAGLYSNDTAVTALAIQLFLFAGIFQVSDAVQIAANGALRGYKDTRIPMLLSLIAYWLVGLPLGYTLAMTDILEPRMGAQGFWIGLIVGLTCAALLLGSRLWWISRHYWRYGIKN